MNELDETGLVELYQWKMDHSIVDGISWHKSIAKRHLQPYQFEA